jgi:hypothetical protein
MWHAWERNEKCTRFWCESPIEGDRTDDQSVEGRMGSECVFGSFSEAGGVLDSTLSGHEPVRPVVNAVMNLRVLAPLIELVVSYSSSPPFSTHGVAGYLYFITQEGMALPKRRRRDRSVT